jgi:hypothetical protein
VNDQTYNGWSNRETWLVNLWMDNEQGSQEYWRERAQEHWDSAADEDDEGECDRERNAIYMLAQELEYFHDEGRCENFGVSDTPSVMFDLLSGALARVEWREIAEHLITEISRN